MSPKNTQAATLISRWRTVYWAIIAMISVSETCSEAKPATDWMESENGLSGNLTSCREFHNESCRSVTPVTSRSR